MDDLAKSLLSKIITDTIEDNEENFAVERKNSWGEGYASGYHDALVDLLNILHIPHQYKIYNS